MRHGSATSDSPGASGSARRYHVLAVVVLVLAVAEAAHARQLLRSLPRELTPVLAQDEATMSAGIRETQARIDVWRSRVIGPRYFESLEKLTAARARRSPREQVEWFNQDVAWGLANARAELRAAVGVSAAWILASVIALTSRALAGPAALLVALAGLLSAPILSEPLLGLDMYELFIRWHLPGVLLGLAMFVTAPRERPLRRRWSAASETRPGRIAVGLGCIALGVGWAAAIYTIPEARLTAIPLLGLLPISLGLRMIVMGLRTR